MVVDRRKAWPTRGNSGDADEVDQLPPTIVPTWIVLFVKAVSGIKVGPDVTVSVPADAALISETSAATAPINENIANLFHK